MDFTEIKDGLWGDPKEFLNKINSWGIDYDSFGSVGIPRKIVENGFGVPPGVFDAVDFVFWIAFLAETTIKQIIIQREQKNSAPDNTIEAIIAMLESMNFWDKINILESHYLKSEHKEFVKVLRVIKDLRNDISHNRIDSLQYENKSLSKPTGQITLLIAFSKASKIVIA